MYIFSVSFSDDEFFPGFKQIFNRDNIRIAMQPSNSSNTPLSYPPQRLLPVLHKLKDVYIVWHEYHQTLAKIHRYLLGQRVASFLIETIEAISVASFLPPSEKLPYVRLAIRKTDTVKVLLLILWETKSLDTKKYSNLSVRIDEIGRMLGGWNGSLTKQNSSRKKEEK